MVTVKWLPEALADIERLHSFLNDKDPEAAARAARAILQGARLLKTTPHIGRPMPDETSRREQFVAFGAGAYVLRYMQEDEKTVVVIRVWHSREDRGSSG
ncbi:type II toxin-antitoxin system RelE/ParE family toxin [Candidatus Saccharibacteria bacterium]|nr:type II toxin-antitoxin system RelE/ParE family toxin [Candidatus Saccharibacteria bacterium]